MIQIKNFVFFLSVLFFSNCFAASNSYNIIVDAGSSGSRLHLYKTIQDKNSLLPIITELLSEKTSPGISSYAEEPQKIKLTIIPLFKTAIARIIKDGATPQQTQVFILATAGMRALPLSDQEKIYSQIKSDLFPYNFSKVILKTINGEQEGIFQWLSVNYATHTLLSPEKSFGVLDLGGTSTQIAFLQQQAIDTKKTIEISLAHQQINLFSHSFLGLGINIARKNAATQSCYLPENKSGPAFNADECATPLDKLITSYNIKNIVPSLPKYCVSKNLLGLNAKNTPINNTINQCFNFVYQKKLLKKFGFDGNTNFITVAEKINGYDITWPLGGLLYFLNYGIHESS